MNNVRAKVVKYVNTGAALCEAGKFPEAIQALNQALALDPKDAIAYLNRGYAHLMTGNPKGMDDDLNRAKELDPQNPEIHFKIGNLCRRVHVYLVAIQALNCAIDLKPDFEDAWGMLADCYYRIGAVDNARNVYNEAHKKFPNNVTFRLEPAYMFPPVLSSQEEIEVVRAEFINNLDKLAAEGLTFTAPEDKVKYLPFYHGYLGRDNRDMLEKLASFFVKTCPEVSYVAPHVSLPRAPKKKLRIGFVFSYLLKDVLGQFMQSMLEALAKSDEFEVWLVVCDAGPQDPNVRKLASRVDRFMVLPDSGVAARKAIAREKFDILAYLEIGMAMRPYFLAMSRLAPVQCNIGCHPMTSGMPSIDYYFSIKDFEPENAQKNYTEKLVIFDRNLAIFHRPKIPERIVTRQQLALPQDATLYTCPVMLFKLHPDMDNVFARILDRDPKGLILLFDSSYKTLWRSTLEKRFARTMTPEHRSRIVFLNHASKEVFYQILCNVDAILDTFHFSFGTTALLTLGANLPFVTWPGEFIRGRCSYGIYRQMGVTDLIAKDQDEYIELALRLANDKAFRAEMAEKIRQNSHKIYEQQDMVEPFAAKLKELYAASCTQEAKHD